MITKIGSTIRFDDRFAYGLTIIQLILNCNEERITFVSTLFFIIQGALKFVPMLKININGGVFY